MGGGDAFFDIIQVTGFICATYFMGYLARAAKMSPIIGELAAGVVLGPEVVKLLKTEHEDFLKLLGQFGVTLMIFESGMHVQFDKLRLVFTKSLTVAILGTGLPIISGLLFALAAFGGSRVYPDGLSMGCSMAPTSVGIALKLLTESKMLSSMTGQTIVTAAFVDDIFSIIALVILMNLAKGDLTAVTITLPIVLSAVFVIGGGYLALRFWPWIMEKILAPIPNDPTASFQRAHQVHLLIMFLTLIAYGAAAHYVGSHLLGAFIGGMSFAAVPRSHAIWARQMKRIAKWLIRLFFSCTVAFSIPISSMMSLSAFWKGLLCGLGPCIGAKLMSGLHSGPERWLVGFAMAGRGEFAFLVAETAKTTEIEGTGNSSASAASGSITGDVLLSEEAYSITVWALLCATIIAPFGFKYFLAKEAAKKGESNGIYSFRLKLKGQHHTGLTHDIQNALREMHLQAEDITTETDGYVMMQTMTVQSKDEAEWLDDEKFETIRAHLFDVLNDPDGQIAVQPIKTALDAEAPTAPGGFTDMPKHVHGEEFRPATFRADMMTAAEVYAQDREKLGRPDRHYVIVKVMSQHSKPFLRKTYDILEKQGLDVCKAKMYTVERYPKPTDAPQKKTQVPEREAEDSSPSCAIKTFYCLDVGAEGTTSGKPSPERLQHIRSELEHQFQVLQVGGKAMIKTCRVENAPVIYGFTPKLHEGVHVADIELVYEQKRDKHLLNRVLQKLLSHGLDVVNLAVDVVEGEKWEDHNVQQATIFAVVPSADCKEQVVASEIVGIFREQDVPVRCRVQLHDAHTVEHGQFDSQPGSPAPLLDGERVGQSTLSGTLQDYVPSGSKVDDSASFVRIDRTQSPSRASRQIALTFCASQPRRAVSGHGSSALLLRVKRKVKEIDDLIDEELQAAAPPASPRSAAASDKPAGSEATRTPQLSALPPPPRSPASRAIDAALPQTSTKSLVPTVSIPTAQR
eukprot:TRINITY_DN47385_c0_g1_i1.p1 TRINITY_DN47385_c0_g1~~TRINITY_DN47385_c0_g1_i1.p1  ORF type:complete len:990 (+),score=257.86 TRINITY_DN47385_c0_g1_i1:70-2970(+)